MAVAPADGVGEATTAVGAIVTVGCIVTVGASVDIGAPGARVDPAVVGEGAAVESAVESPLVELP